jgi:cell wall assembly regulator SMI1
MFSHMARKRKTLLVVVVALVVVFGVLILAGPTLQRSFFYPKPRDLPPVVGQTTSQLLTRLQAVLETNAPIVVRALQPGLSDSQISTLESQGAFRLSEDLRALYHWHNGMSSNSAIGLLAGQRFLPLDEMVLERTLEHQEVGSATSVQRAAFAVFVGHKKSWLQVLDDGAGDGYFYDPKRTDAEGAFFYNSAENGYYVWFPSLRNFLAGVIECFETRAVKTASDSTSLDEDFHQTQKIWERLGKTSETGG